MKRICLCILLALCGAAEADDTITKITSRHLPPAEVKRRVLDQLSHVLILPAYTAKGPPPERPLSDLTFWTAPYETDSRDLCARDEVTVKFRHRGAKADASTPVEAYGIETLREYHFAVPPKTPEQDIRDGSQTGTDSPACTGLDLFSTPAFTANSEQDAWTGTWLAGEVARRAADKDFAARIQCSGGDEFMHECAAELAALKADHISGIQECPAEDGGILYCYLVIMTPGLNLEIHWRQHRDGISVERVVVHETVIVLNPLPD
jgi:hypothetical protein